MIPRSVDLQQSSAAAADQVCVKVQEQRPSSPLPTSMTTSTSQSTGKSFADKWASLVTDSSARDHDRELNSPIPSACASPIDEEFDNYFAEYRPHDLSYRVRREINPYVEAQLFGTFRSFKKSQMPPNGPLSPMKRKLTDCKDSTQAIVAESREAFLNTSHQTYVSCVADLPTSSDRVVRQKRSDSD